LRGQSSRLCSYNSASVS